MDNYKLRISATYRAGQVGDVVAAGQPETVEIELNDDAVPSGSPDLAAFVAHLVSTLFRLAPQETVADVTIDDSFSDPARATAGGGVDLELPGTAWPAAQPAEADQVEAAR
jgi:hypothetical protein